MEPEKAKGTGGGLSPGGVPFSASAVRGRGRASPEKEPLSAVQQKHPDQSVDRDCLYGVPGDYVHPCLCLGKKIMAL